MAADLLDVITLAAAKVAINQPAATASHDGQLERFITAISRRMDEVIGPVVNRAVTEYHDGGGCALWPRQTPVSSITTLTEASGTTTTELTAQTFGTEADYILEQSGSYAHDHRIVKVSGTFPTGHQNVQLVYVAGRAANTAAVNARIVSAAGMIMRRLWRRESSSWAQTNVWDEATEPTLGVGFFKVVDPMIAEFLADEMKPPGIA